VAEGQKKIPIVVIAIIGVLLLLMAGGISYFIASYIAGDRVQTSKYSEPGRLFKIGDPKDGLIVNVGGGNSAHYVKTSIVLELRPSKNDAKESKGFSIEEVKMADAVVRVLRAQKVEDFDAGKQDAIREKIKTEVNSALGEEKVMHVYITGFVLQ
jgi:flagellar FliL protein